jgi:hypothetical protein
MTRWDLFDDLIGAVCDCGKARAPGITRGG